MRRVFGALAFASLLLFASSALASEPGDGRGSPFRLTLEIDLPVLAGAAAIAAGTELAKAESSGPWCGLSCDPAKVPSFDRGAIGNHSATAATVSDGFMFWSVGAPYLFDGLDVALSGERFGDWATDAAVLSEVAVVNVALNNVVKLAVARPRPLVYDATVDDATRLDPDSALSFYSGHSSTSFAMATAYSYLFTLRHPDSPWVFPVWIFSEGLAAATASLRVVAGKHFPSDVVVGGVVGASIGLLVPFMHRVVPTPTFRIEGNVVFGFRVVPYASPDGAGLILQSSP